MKLKEKCELVIGFLNFGLSLNGLVVSGLKQEKEMGFVKRNGNSSKTGKKRRRRHCGKFHLVGTLTGRLGGQTTSVSAQILRGCSTRREEQSYGGQSCF